ncbi:redoxin domain-containing protein [Pedobacter nutrimenti]|uniref:redoxin domain-containing protein n=1 Tax=Pedobacter nutrimenti TaxID=1241337 RepID=UPI002931D7D0|nr:redoxin domain-containing protein [Pedobacter nutrimenti]
MAIKLSGPYRFRSFLWVLFLVASQYGFAQQQVQALDTGQYVPNVVITNFFEQPGKQLALGDLKGKLVILDFWNIHCSACLDGMPEMDSLQKLFGDKIKILLVTKDKSSDVKKLFDRIGMHQKIKSLEVVTNDTILSILFPHQADPHHVWIDQHGTYRYGTFIYNTTKENIDKMFRAQQLKVTQRENLKSIETEKPMLNQLNKKMNKHLDQYSIFLKELSGVIALGASWFSIDSTSKVRNGFTSYNIMPNQLIDAAFNHDIYGYDPGIYNLIKNKRIILAVKDSSDFITPTKFSKIDAWYKKNFITYEVRVANPNNLYRQMQADLNNYLSYRFSMEKRKMSCYVISIHGNTDSMKTLLGSKSMYKVINGQMILRNQPLGTMLRIFEESQKAGNPFFVDQTGYKGNINVTFSFNAINNPVALNKELKKYGMKIEKKNVAIPMLVVYDK